MTIIAKNLKGGGKTLTYLLAAIFAAVVCFSNAAFASSDLLPVIPQPTEWKPSAGECALDAAKVTYLIRTDLGLGEEGYTMDIAPGAIGVADFGDAEVRLVARTDGVAYRFVLKKPGVVEWERANLTVPISARCWFNRTGRALLGCEETMPEFMNTVQLATEKGRAYYLPFVYFVDGKTVAVKPYSSLATRGKALVAVFNTTTGSVKHRKAGV